MNIGIVCYPTYGGSGVLATELGKALAKKGHKVHFMTYSLPPRLDYFDENISYHEVNVSDYSLFLHQPYGQALASTIVRVMQTEKLDILHVHYAIPHAAAAYLARQILFKKGIYLPFITTLHGTDITLIGRDPSYNPVVSFSIEESDGVTAVSNSLREETYERFDVQADIRVIYNFIDLHRFQKREPKMICSKDEKLLVHVSNFRKVKRIQDVIQVFYRVQKEIPSRLLLVGDGEERLEMEMLCQSLGIDKKVRFLGKVDAVEEILRSSDLFLLTSEKESFGLSALEAMACGLPVISSNTGGIPEVNLHGYSGFLSNVGDVDDMAKNAVYILSEANLSQFKQQALQHAKKFDAENIIPQYESYYQEIIDKTRNKK